jgi:hypothetical protein
MIKQTKKYKYRSPGLQNKYRKGKGMMQTEQSNADKV